MRKAQVPCGALNQPIPGLVSTPTKPQRREFPGRRSESPPEAAFFEECVDSLLGSQRKTGAEIARV